jgi:P pilus assembly chaperone PapD
MDVRRRHLHAVIDLHAQRAVAAVRRLAATGVVAALASGGPVAAQAPVSIEATPLRVEVVGQPGSSHTQAVTVINPGTERVRVRATLTDWHLSKDGAPQFQPPLDGRPFAAAAWVRFAPPEFVLDPAQQGVVRFTITVPTGVAAGGYRTGLLFEFVPETPDPAAKARQVVFRSRIATLIYVHVGQPSPAVELTNLEIRGTGERTQIVAALKNTSRRSVRTKGTLAVFDRQGVAVAQLVVPDVPILPESERELAINTAESTQPLVAGTYRVELRLDVGMTALLVGETTMRIDK